MKSEKRELIIFFDGVCGLCNGFIDFVIKVDRKASFRFSPLQSDFATSKLPQEYIKNLDSVVVLIDGKTQTKSQAVFAVLNELGGKWKFASLIGKLPTSFLNLGYDLVASNRYKIFGKKESCRIPSPEERDRFVLNSEA